MIHTVSFPGLGLTFTLNRVAFTLLGRPVYWYGLSFKQKSVSIEVF